MRQQSKLNRVMPWLKVGVFLLALLPFIKLILGFYQDDLGANPIEKITHTTGFWTLSFLLITLTATPLRLITHWSWPIRLRRMLGLFAFFYACLHFLTYLILDQFFDAAAIIEDISKRPYITLGFTAFVLLTPLAISSNDTITRKIGSKNWRRLHSLIYPIAIVGVIHFAWLVKKDLSTPLMFAGLLSTLLLIRLFYRR
ncbi:sulfoxide reductase heme-binding subunit YedZ [Methylomonas lenta]|uniref:Protein-methionine-sulfoxide reductase heme-binding subunit MsrQ n=1 Tax=Methylomonas lenta TaxID=980561 RepID=A0A177NRN8_9GAMM|nr:protein-methionine-sulfoxide reductase heme-binding subunit MsrQ [Methylomonas lenta]OAI20561.1 sulfoxide reductase heme-binding subunit YedZ [Methylomonas lenta]